MTQPPGSSDRPPSPWAPVPPGSFQPPPGGVPESAGDFGPLSNLPSPPPRGVPGPHIPPPIDVPAPGMSPASAGYPPPQSEGPQRGKSRRWLWPVSASIIAALVVGVLGFIMYRQSGLGSVTATTTSTSTAEAPYSPEPGVVSDSPSAPKAPSTDASIPAGYFRLQTSDSGSQRCLQGDVPPPDVRGVAASMAPCSDSPAQLWRLAPSVISGYFKLQTRESGSALCLEGGGLKALVGGVAFLDTCQTVSGQQWTVVPIKASDSKHVELHTQYTGPDFCLHGSPLDNDPGDRVSMQPCQQTPQQIWLKITSG